MHLPTTRSPSLLSDVQSDPCIVDLLTTVSTPVKYNLYHNGHIVEVLRLEVSVRTLNENSKDKVVAVLTSKISHGTTHVNFVLFYNVYRI